MLFEKYNLKEWKLIYLSLMARTWHTPELLDCELLNDLQTYLQGKAESIDLDPLDHETWINWLNNAEKCGASVQVSNRKPMNIMGAVLPEIKSPN
jgi:hypothetical protein